CTGLAGGSLKRAFLQLPAGEAGTPALAKVPFVGGFSTRVFGILDPGGDLGENRCCRVWGILAESGRGRLVPAQDDEAFDEQGKDYPIIQRAAVGGRCDSHRSLPADRVVPSGHGPF
ncbi:MAG: hypothetical protein Q8M16_18945, partial [Pirellulaceae bacterium]|nr:hypothetical protein [Pirellulaceae bacterium]